MVGREAPAQHPPVQHRAPGAQQLPLLLLQQHLAAAAAAVASRGGAGGGSWRRALGAGGRCAFGWRRLLLAARPRGDEERGHPRQALVDARHLLHQGLRGAARQQGGKGAWAAPLAPPLPTTGVARSLPPQRMAAAPVSLGQEPTLPRQGWPGRACVAAGCGRAGRAVTGRPLAAGRCIGSPPAGRPAHACWEPACVTHPTLTRKSKLMTDDIGSHILITSCTCRCPLWRVISHSTTTCGWRAGRKQGALCLPYKTEQHSLPADDAMA
jgi:hypothetical protein